MRPSSSSVTAASMPSSLHSQQQPQPLFRSLREQLRFAHHSDAIQETEKEHRRRLIASESKVFQHLFDVLVRSSILEQSKSELRNKFFAREAHFRAALELERSAWATVCAELMSEFEEKIEESGRHVVKPRRKSQVDNDDQPLAMTEQEHREQKQEDVADSTPADAATVPAVHKSASRQVSFSPHHNNNGSSSSSAVVAEQNRQRLVELTRARKAQQLQRKPSPTRSSVLRADIGASAVKARASSSQNRKKQNSPTKTETELRREALYKQLAANRHERVNPFLPLIERDAASYLVPDIVKVRIDNLLVEHGARNDAGKSVVERTAQERRQQQIEQAKLRRDDVLLASLLNNNDFV